MKRSVPRLQGAARDAAKNELIGLAATVIESPDAGLVGRKGTIVDETLHTLDLRLGGHGARVMRLAKHAVVLRLETLQGPVDVDGRAISYRPVDRTKKVR